MNRRFEKDVRVYRRGFTMVEVLMSLLIMGIGTAALFGLQGMIARSNLQARQMSIAVEILGTWLERLKADAVHWTAAGNPTNTQYLVNVGTATPTPWLVPTANTTNFGNLGHQPAFNAFGVDIAPNSTGIAFCASYRVSWMAQGDAIRADVRVFWPKENIPAQSANAYADCGAATPASLSLLDPGGQHYPYYHAVYASTVLRWNPAPSRVEPIP